MRTKLALLLLAFAFVYAFVSLKNRISGDDHPHAKHIEVTVDRDHEHAHQPDVTERMIHESFDVEEGEALEVRISHADVDVQSTAASEVTVDVHLHAEDWSRATEYFDKLDFRVYRQDGTVYVTTDPPNNLNWSENRNGRAEITVQIAIPERFNAQIVTSHGDVELDGLEGELSVMTSHGDVETGSIRGPSLTITTSHGDVEAGSAAASEVSIQTSHGDIELSTIEAETVRITTSHGDVEARRIAGETHIATSHGDVQFAVENAFNTEVFTSHGDISIRADGSLQANIDLRGDQVSVDYAVRGTVKPDAVDGTLNGGGPRIVAHASNGSIWLGRN